MPQTPNRIHAEEEPSNRDIMDAVMRLDARTARVEHLLNGSSNPANGLVIRVDRLEQAQETRKVWTGTAVAAAVSGLGTAVWLFIKAAAKGEG